LLPFVSLGALRASDGSVTYLAHSAVHEPVVASSPLASPREVRVLRPARQLGLDPGVVSQAEAITFPTTGSLPGEGGAAAAAGGGAVAHAYFYPPRNPGYVAPAGELPPLLVLSHGGPTSGASAAFNLAV